MSGLKKTIQLILAVMFLTAAVSPAFADDDDDKGKKKNKKDYISFTYVAPPEIGLPKGLTSIAFIPFSQAVEDREGIFSAREKKMGDEITSAIAQRMQEVSRQFKIPLSLVDRESIAAIMKEKDLADAGITQENKALQLGKLAKAQTICFGRMAIDVHKEEGVTQTLRPTFSQGEQIIVQRDRWHPNRRYVSRQPTIQGGLGTEQVRQIRRTITVSATVKLVSTVTGKSIVTFNRRVSETAERKPGFFMGQDAQEIQLRPEDETIERLFNQLVDEFVGQLLPHEVRVEVKIAKPKAKLAKTALKFLQTGDLEKAIDLFEEALKTKPDDHAARYDLGIAYECSGRLGEALKNYELAFRLKDNSLYFEASRRLRQSLPPGKTGQKDRAQPKPPADNDNESETVESNTSLPQ
jgi:tetratricopeptide (TPR) repeat protein